MARVRDIREVEWRPFLEAFSREHRAWLATVDRSEPGGLPHVEISERPLAAVTAHAEPGGGSWIEIAFQQDSGADTSVEVGAPARLTVDDTGGAARTLEIEDEEGGLTRVRFRVPSPPGLIDGVTPGEELTP